MYFVFLHFGKISYLSLYYDMLTYTHSFCHCNIHCWRQLWFLKVDNGTIFNRNIISHEDTFGIWCSHGVNFKPIYFKTFNRTVVVVIGSKLFPFSGGKTRLLWQFQFWLRSKTLNTCHGILAIHYGCILQTCQNVTGFQPLLLREKKKNMNTE